MTSTPSRKIGTFVWNLSKIVLALGLLIYVLSSAELTSLISALKNASVFWLIVSGVLYFLLTLLKALQYHVLMQEELTLCSGIKRDRLAKCSFEFFFSRRGNIDVYYDDTFGA